MKSVIAIVGSIIISGTVQERPKTETVTICNQNGCYQVVKVVSVE